jgi:hypothetical protein
MKNVLPHVDNYNSHQPNFNFLLIVSCIGKIGETSGETQYARLANICYGRKSIDDYYHRVQSFGSLLTHMDKFMKTLPNRRKQYNCNVIRNKIVNCVVENECVVRDAYMDKACYLSTFVYVLLLMINKFGLSLEQELKLFYQWDGLRNLTSYVPL